MSETTRRAVLAGAAGVGAAAALAACGDSETSGGSGSSSQPTAGGATTAGGGATGAATGGSTGGGGALATKSDIPVGGGKIFNDQGVVVTQPTAGDFRAFSATCTHAGCTVASVSNGTINCSCHGSKFSAADGSVKNGPAAKPLASKSITVEGDSISVG